MVQSAAKAPSVRAATRRLGGRKDRTGCITCKIRRVKCDEGKPACHRCTSTGRKCDGYDLNTLTTLAVVQPQQLMGSGVPVSSPQEHAAFQFFVHTGVSTMAGCTDIAFWTRLLPQYAQSDAAVYHASVAVGALLMRFMNCKGGPHGQRAQQLTLLAVKRQNQAIHSTVISLAAQGTIARQPAACACAMTLFLLFCIEALQGREEEALQLIQRGVNALISTGSTTATAGLDAQLDRLRLQCGMFNASGAREALRGKLRAMERVILPTIALTTIDEARDELSDLIAAVQHTVSDSWDRPCDTQERLPQTLEAALNSWRMRFERFVAALPGWPNAVSHHDDNLVCQLRLRERIAHIWLVDSPDSNELAYDSDKYARIFADIVNEAGRCLQNIRGSGSDNTKQAATPIFTFEMGFIPPLYWAFLKCRRPLLRRQLLALLRKTPLQEGLWNRRIMVQVAEKVMAYEEAERSEVQVSITRSESEDEHAFALRGESASASSGQGDITAERQAHAQEGQQEEQGHRGKQGRHGQQVQQQAQQAQQAQQVHHADVHFPSHQQLHLLPEPGLPPETARIKVVQIGLRTTLVDGSPGDIVQCFGRPGGVEGGLQVVLEFVATAT
ncbi:hypothetical protein SCUCBS95973_001568 [Sporothrix curviconia]|uniref:Zn(2)-C6 fungal-type domain-containing protein n=1 Tax=Sporothrix curviconia TaxID=1260050 RepID=A0ABP0AZM5_9PEZI